MFHWQQTVTTINARPSLYRTADLRTFLRKKSQEHKRDQCRYCSAETHAIEKKFLNDAANKNWDLLLFAGAKTPMDRQQNETVGFVAATVSRRTMFFKRHKPPRKLKTATAQRLAANVKSVESWSSSDLIPIGQIKREAKETASCSSIAAAHGPDLKTTCMEEKMDCSSAVHVRGRLCSEASSASDVIFVPANDDNVIVISDDEEDAEMLLDLLTNFPRKYI